MNGKQRMLAAIPGDRLTEVPVTPHWWGVYKFQLAGVVHGPQDENPGWALWGEDLAQVDAIFYETFHPDMIHLSTGAWQALPGDANAPTLAVSCALRSWRLRASAPLMNTLPLSRPPNRRFKASGIYAHVPVLVEKYGDQALVLMNEGNPVCEVFENGGPVGDFQDALVATVEHPDNLAYLLWKLYDAALGAHACLAAPRCAWLYRF